MVAKTWYNISMFEEWKIEKIVKKGDYLYAVVPDHPNATKHGYVLEHRVVMENYLGRLLTKGEVVHHLDGNKHNNQIENLELLDKSTTPPDCQNPLHSPGDGCYYQD